MSYGKAVYEAADAALQRRRSENKKEYDDRRRRVFASYPRIAEIEHEMSEGSLAIIGEIFEKSGDLHERIARIKEKNINLQMERAELLVTIGLPVDYLDEIYKCPVCHDKGIVNGRRCECYEKELKKAAYEQSVLGGTLSNQTFENFNLDFYSQKKAPGGISPYENMMRNKQLCERFVEDFSHSSLSILMTGGTGLGKTHLSTSIARRLINRGVGVVYVTAPELFDRFESLKFNRASIYGDTVDVQEFFDCDLLIIDDLGSEFSTQFVESALFSVINGRAIKGKSTIINTNCDLAQLESIYNKKIVSRIIGDFLIMPFTGEDVRMQKRKKNL
ncbi:MAG: ATP-binding protein [Bacillota bacterium]|nr:ATP-binding protein [Bacillota bacterium]